jgi:phage shock protein PspC (stress-responsive transcriptional regulator)
MICAQCKKEIAEYSAYCSFCGAQQSPGPPRRRLLLSATDSKIAGVCGGIGEYFGIDSTVVRLVWAALTVVPGAFVGGILAYVFAWIIIPKAAQSAPASSSIEHAAKT